MSEMYKRKNVLPSDRMGNPASLFDLTGKVAVVTGSTKGIGRAMIEGLAAAGASVVVSSRKQDLCDQVAAEIRAATGADVLALACHVGDWDAIPAFVDGVKARFGRIDVLVNNAAITPTRLTVTNMEVGIWRKIFNVNVEGPLRTSQLIAPIMRDGGGGSIINIASMAAYHAGPGVCAYGASKAALKNLTMTMSQEWAPWKVRVNLLSPGPFVSEMTSGAAAHQVGYWDLLASVTQLKRVADPTEIVGPILYLASDASSFVTGDDISVSGGMQK
jgi:NAD(P)-dependent dehydrogenase (short-subunit alcohol dehydrogenase family)